MKRATVLVALLFPLLSLTWTALAQTGDGYDLSWWTADGSGTSQSSGGAYALASTAGQPDAGVLSGGDYTLRGGFQQCVVLHDLNGDGRVNMSDVQFVASRWHSPSPGLADRNGDGQVTIVDIMLVVAQWGQGC